MAAPVSPPPNVLLLITDQQRYPCHWPEDPGWLRDLMPNDRRLADTGLSFPEGVLQHVDVLAQPRDAADRSIPRPARRDPHPHAGRPAAGSAEPAGGGGDAGRHPAAAGAPRRRALRQFGRGLLQLGPKSGDEPELRPDTPNLAQMLRGGRL